MFSDFKFLLNRAVRRTGASPYVEEKNILKYFFGFLGELFEGDVEQKFKVIDFKEGIISVASLCEMNGENLRKKKDILIDKINKKLNSTVVKGIKVIT